MKRVAVLALLVACGSDDSDGMQRLTDCDLAIVISGGYDKTIENPDPRQIGCGATGGPTGTSIGVEIYGPGENDFHGVSVVFDPPIMMEQVGDIPVGVVVEVDSATMDRAVWETAPGACNYNVVKNEFTEDDFFMNKYVIGGTVTCPSTIAPDSENTLPAITVNAFMIQTFVDY